MSSSVQSSSPAPLSDDERFAARLLGLRADGPAARRLLRRETQG